HDRRDVDPALADDGAGSVGIDGEGVTPVGIGLSLSGRARTLVALSCHRHESHGRLRKRLAVERHPSRHGADRVRSNATPGRRQHGRRNKKSQAHRQTPEGGGRSDLTPGPTPNSEWKSGGEGATRPVTATSPLLRSRSWPWPRTAACRCSG